MTFPVMIGPFPPHPVFEVLAYFVGFRLYLFARRKAGDHLEDDRRWWVIAGAVCGAWLGSKVIYWLCDPALTLAHLADVGYMLGGKTIVGGLAGGLAGVELTKKALGVTRSTGDLFALPLCAGMAIGRIGCFLTGLTDRTCGVATAVPWGVDFGDGIPRHPAQLYEIAFLAVLAGWLTWRKRRPLPEGTLFREFLAGYMAFRLLAETIKPGVPIAGLTAIQWTCVAVLIHYAVGLGYSRLTAGGRRRVS
ncbi:MAG: prolipoprotein diacylglyceryl transferase [Cyanobacteria bacterium RYN_339]|nr:prolipoprotein diacylglyceryl transferase [Cyanobacteria bacterium RYN_339]